VLAGFAHTDVTLMTDRGVELAELLALESGLHARSAQYAAFLQHEGKRASDAYAAFQPFNESTRALFPFIDVLRSRLRPGDLILDTWCRTGLSGALLAQLFPEQHVLSLWEGNLGVLGHAGFRHWLGSEARPSNWDVMFLDPGRGLPFLDGSFALVHGLDSLHRYPFQPFLADCLRVTSATGTLVFPHIHLDNSEPDPFFERGGVKVHGKRYRAYFDRVLAGDARRAFVMSERYLFEHERDARLADQSDTPEYNGLIAILPRELDGMPLSMPEFRPGPRDLLQPNPLLGVDAGTGEVALRPQAMGSSVAEMLMRHPCYADRLAQRMPARLSREQSMLWQWLEAGATWSECVERSGLSVHEAESALSGLIRGELVMALPLGEAMSRLQYYYARRAIARPLSEQCFATLWNSAAAIYGDRDLLLADDGSAFRVEDARQVVGALAAMLSARGIGRGSRVALVAGGHAESILAVWSCWLRGAVACPIDPALPVEARRAILDRLSPVLVLVDAAHAGVVDPRAPTLVFESSAETGAHHGLPSLGDALAPFLDLPVELAPATESDPAAILFTSGTTGKPKGVVLAHGALARGAATLSDEYGWQPGDVLACPGGLHTMSGLRNNCVTPLVRGVTVLASDARAFSHPATAAAACRRWNVSLLSIVPAFLFGVRADDRRHAWGPLRQVLCTGATLPLVVQAEAESRLGAPVHVYYGLTETGGVCTLLPPGVARLADGDIGVPAGAQLRLVDGNGEAVDDPQGVGELEVYSANLMLGYLDDADATARRLNDGWLRTGDLVARESGHFILRGRNDDLVKSRTGEIVDLAAIEHLLHGHQDVGEAVVVGADTASGPRVEAWVIPRGARGPESLVDLQGWLSERLGARTSPSRVHLVDSLPRGANGKVVRADLRIRIIEAVP